MRIFLPARKKSIVLGHFSFQFELWFFLIWSWSIPVGASEIRCSTRIFAVSKTAATDHSRHESAKCEQDSVFECLLTAAQYVTLKAELTALIEPETDSLRFYRLGNQYKQNVEHVGVQPAYAQDSVLLI